MIYVIEGEEELFIKQKIHEITDTEDSEISYFDGNSSSFDINAVIELCFGNSLFSDRSTLLVKDPPFLIKKVDEKNLESLLDYIDNPVFETNLIFFTYENKFNSKLKIYKDICKNAKVLVLNSYDYKNFNTYVNHEINKYKLNISSDAIFELNSICKRNATLLNRNIEILLNYPERITVDVIQKLCTSLDDNDSFELINALTNKKISKSISIVRKMLKDSDSILSIIGLLASQLRFLYQLSYYLYIGKTKKEILDECKCSEYRYNKALETLRKLNMTEIMKLLNDLSNLELECKSNNTISDSTRLELYILNLLK